MTRASETIGALAERVLVVLDGTSPDRYDPDNAVVRRAADFAGRAGSALMLLQVCYESSLTYGSFASRREIDAARNTVLDTETRKIKELQGALASRLSLPVDYRVLWNHDRCESILEQARDWGADVIFKEKGDRNFVLGLFSTTDWDLLRNAPAQVWFVSPDNPRSPQAGVVAAVDPLGDQPDSEEHFQLDDTVFQHAKLLADVYAGPLGVVHAYQLPRGVVGLQGYAPLYPGVAAAATSAASAEMAEVDRETRDAIARRHGEAIQTFVDEHGIPLDELVVREGPAPDVIRDVAESREAGLVVMGAGDKGRWQRLLGHVSAEPALADAPCDVLVVHSGTGERG